jgi:pimeloyl-ACP methyl ester carboxylesterase
MANMKQFRIRVLLLLLCCSSCTFNKLFYQPERMPKPPVSFQLRNREKHDTVYVSIADSNCQPVFRNAQHGPYDPGYTLESVFFRSGDGNRLNGWWLKPGRVQPNGITLLFLHGNGGNVLSQFAGAVPFVQRGFKVLLIDYSGYGYSEGHSTRKNFLTDGNSALSYLLGRPDVRGDKIVIYGQSLGGHLSATVAAQNEARIDGLVMEGAPSSHKDIAAYMSRPFGFTARLLVKEGYSARASIAQYHKPLLLIHSSEDRTVPFFLSHKIYERANAPKEFYEIKHGHIMGPEYYADSIAAKIVRIVRG